MHSDSNPAALPLGWDSSLTSDEAAALLRHLHDLAHDPEPERRDHLGETL